MAKHIMPDQAYLREVLDYDPETGVLSWKDRPLSHFSNVTQHKIWKRRFLHQKVGCLNRFGYVQIGIDTVGYFAHRIIWKWMTGIDPINDVDHKNRNRSDNRFENLREATKEENARNSAPKRRNISAGLKGAELNPKSGKFRSKIQANGQRINLGTFTTKEAAHEAYCKAARELYGEFWSPD